VALRLYCCQHSLTKLGFSRQHIMSTILSGAFVRAFVQKHARNII